MSPIIWAALISGGWAVAVAAIGYYYNRVTAKSTIQATNANALAALDAAHEAQLWEKKAESYLDVLAAVLHRAVDWKAWPAARSRIRTPKRPCGKQSPHRTIRTG